jgi:drug/metabolite transporter superfamily protein YnfA
MGLTCVLNARRCGRTHCYATGPVFLVASLLLALVAGGVLPHGWVDGIGLGALVGTALALGFEWVLGRRYLHA